MLELKTAIRRLVDKMPEDLERALLARVRAHRRKDRERVKNGTLSRGAARRRAESAAVKELLEKVNKGIEEINTLSNEKPNS